MKNLRRLRELAGWSQLELSDATGIERSKLSQENGHIAPRAVEQENIEQALLAAITQRDVGRLIPVWSAINFASLDQGGVH